jgi:23S rRNA (pseudouridine1915-N3)-methyltransferase
LPNIRIVSIGRDKDEWISAGCEHYRKLLGRYARVTFEYLPSLKGAASLSADEIRAKEAAKLSAVIGSGFVIALHDRGRDFDSPTFAREFEKIETHARGSLTLVIGGPYGLHESILERADLVWSLSPMTYSHQLVRLVVLEQLYRAYSIRHGTSYHK